GLGLAIAKMAQLWRGTDGTDWILNEGVGTQELRDQGGRFVRRRGALLREGVEANVQRAVNWVKRRQGEVRDKLTVNLAGHSRGSVTCYKIARALCDDPSTKDIPVNLFAIDPVPGNTGSLNKVMAVKGSRPHNELLAFPAPRAGWRP